MLTVAGRCLPHCALRGHNNRTQEGAQSRCIWRLSRLAAKRRRWIARRPGWRHCARAQRPSERSSR